MTPLTADDLGSFLRPMTTVTKLSLSTHWNYAACCQLDDSAIEVIASRRILAHFKYNILVSHNKIMSEPTIYTDLLTGLSVSAYQQCIE